MATSTWPQARIVKLSPRGNQPAIELVGHLLAWNLVPTEQPNGCEGHRTSRTGAPTVQVGAPVVGMHQADNSQDATGVGV